MSMTKTSTWKLGTTSAGVAPIPDPDINIDRTPEIVGGSTTTLMGRMRNDTFAVKRTWGMTWTGLTQAQANALEAYRIGTNGKGPFYLVDPVLSLTTTILVNVTDFKYTSVYEGRADCTMSFREV